MSQVSKADGARSRYTPFISSNAPRQTLLPPLALATTSQANSVAKPVGPSRVKDQVFRTSSASVASKEECDYFWADELVPFRQGHLDSFWGLYAAINALNWARSDMVIEDEEASELFQHLVPIANELVNQRIAHFDGLKGSELEFVIRAIIHAQRIVGRWYRLALPSTYGEMPDGRQLRRKALIRAITRRHNCALMVRISNVA